MSGVEQGSQNPVILIIDDTPANVKVIMEYLAEHGFQIMVARSGETGLKLARRDQPDLILLDLMLPGINGFEVCRRLKNDERSRQIPVIFITILTGVEDKVKGFQAGGVDYITKPFQAEEVLTRVRIHLQLRELTEHLEKKVADRTEELHMANARLQCELAERKHAQAKLAGERALLRCLIDSVSDLIFIKDLNGVYQGCNKAGEAFIGLPECEQIGKSDFELFDREKAEDILKADRRVFEEGRSLRIEEWVTGFDGRRLLIETLKAPYYDPDGKIAGLVGIGRDITERKKLEEQLRQSQKMEAIGQLAGGIAHDFNNILGVIIGQAELMDVFDIPENELKARSRLGELLKASYRAKELVDQILAISRKSDCEKRPVQVNLIIKEAIKFLRASIPATIEIRCNIETFASVLCDPSQIHQIIMNLCANASHAMKEKGGELEINLREMNIDANSMEAYSHVNPGSYIMLTVSDTGHGMNRDTMAKIFDPYFTTKSKGEGTGLGLAVVHGIVGSFGGYISVSSAPGRGTTFQVLLPRADRKIPGLEKKTEIVSGSEHILFVDDEESILNTGRAMLENLGYTVTAFSDSAEALETFKSMPDWFDLVITDLAMPRMTGIDLAREMSAIRPNLPIIICTGFIEETQRERIKSMGIRTLIFKPLRLHYLAETVKKELDVKKTITGKR